MCLAQEMPAAQPEKLRWADVCDSDEEDLECPASTLDTERPAEPVTMAACSLPPGCWATPAKQAEPSEKLQCQFIIGIEEESRFRVAGRVLGRVGANVKAIAAETGARLRLRGRGSKFLEGPERVESQDPLMLCVSAPSRAAYDEAVARVAEILQCVYLDYGRFCARERLPLWYLPQIQLHEGPRESW